MINGDQTVAQAREGLIWGMALFAIFLPALSQCDISSISGVWKSLYGEDITHCFPTSTTIRGWTRLALSLCIIILLGEIFTIAIQSIKKKLTKPSRNSR